MARDTRTSPQILIPGARGGEDKAGDSRVRGTQTSRVQAFLSLVRAGGGLEVVVGPGNPRRPLCLDLRPTCAGFSHLPDIPSILKSICFNAWSCCICLQLSLLHWFLGNYPGHSGIHHSRLQEDLSPCCFTLKSPATCLPTQAHCVSST